MENTLLDAAFTLMTAGEVRTDPLNPYVNLDKARLHELKRRFPREEPQAVEDAYRRAKHLLDVAVELAKLSRGPQNDETGPPFDKLALADRCFGFSRATSDAALERGILLTQ